MVDRNIGNGKDLDHKRKKRKKRWSLRNGPKANYQLAKEEERDIEMVNGRKRKIKATASVFSTTNEIVTVE